MIFKMNYWLRICLVVACPLLFFYAGMSMSNDSRSLFVATFNKEGTLVLRRSDNKEFSIRSSIMATPRFQSSLPPGPEDGEPVLLDIRTFQGLSLTYYGIDEVVCSKTGDDACQQTLMRILLVFVYDEQLYRVVAYRKEHENR